MRLSLFRAKEALQHRSPADRLEFRINRCQERYLTSGKYNGSIHTLALNLRYGELALPPQYRTVEGIKVDGIVRDIVNHWYLYMPGKADTYGYSMEQVRDLDDGHATMYNLPLGGRNYTSGVGATVVGGGGIGATVLIETRDGHITGVNVDQPGIGFTSVPAIVFTGGTGANAVAKISNNQLDSVSLIIGGTLTLDYPGAETLTLTIYGTDENYLPVELAITGKTTVSNPFRQIDRIHRERGTVAMTLTHTAIDGPTTPMAIMAPREEETFLRRYIVDSLASKQESTVAALCKLRHIEFTSDEDILPISNISALELGMDALQFEAENDITLANQYWASGLRVLNDELKDSYAVDEVPVIRFVYPGHTAPRFTSRY